MSIRTSSSHPLVALGDVLESISMGPFGSNLKVETFRESGVPVLRGGNLAGHRVDDSDTVFVTPEKAAELSRSLARPGDIVITHRGTLGQVSLIPRDAKYPEYLVSQSQLRITPDANQAASEYITYWLHSRVGQQQLLSYASQTGVPAISQPTTSIKCLQIPLPPLETQRAIAEVLGALDDKIAANHRAIEIGRALLLAKWQRATSGSTDIVFLEDIASINPRTPVASEPEPPYLDMKNLPEFGLLVSDWGSREPRGGARFQNGDSLLARITPCFENGKMAFVDFLEEGQVGYGSTEYIVLRPKPGIPAAVPYVISANPEFRAAAALLRTGTSGRQRVQGSELASSVIVIPDRESLCEFGKFSQALLKRLGAARTENQVLASTRDELLPLLMSGRITVGAASSRVEEVV
ncbi:restriction endonuclease subunit S [Schaalia sp. JY-X159]|uniref:restriction endonuclease subunit S n=1 Tax=Schaalia sp. JY-X159 TaxID=2758575 RepID=UPI00165E6B31|nr:restriction endonuclease subunit S [Schaalia sp. JY-X159]